MAMDTVKIADLKARLSEHLRKVRQGRALTVLDRDRAIAPIVPYDGEQRPLTVRSPRPGARPCRECHSRHRYGRRSTPWLYSGRSGRATGDRQPRLVGAPSQGAQSAGALKEWDHPH